jgi:hypothetical protein
MKKVYLSPERTRFAAEVYTRRLIEGCVVCREKDGRAICPTCMSHVGCGPGCDECLPYRRR